MEIVRRPIFILWILAIPLTGTACRGSVDKSLRGVWSVAAVSENGVLHAFGRNRAFLSFEADRVTMTECAYFNDADPLFPQQTERHCPYEALRCVVKAPVLQSKSETITYTVRAYVPVCERADGNCGVSPRPLGWPILGAATSTVKPRSDRSLQLEHSAGQEHPSSAIITLMPVNSSPPVVGGCTQ